MNQIPESFNLKVDNSHITNGVRGDAGSCPIALSLHKFLGDDYTVTVTVNGPIVAKNKNFPCEKYVFEDENWVGSWANLFDEGGNVKPIDIDFEVDYEEDEEDEDGILVHHGEAKIYDICETIEAWEEIYG